MTNMVLNDANVMVNASVNPDKAHNALLIYGGEWTALASNLNQDVKYEIHINFNAKFAELKFVISGVIEIKYEFKKGNMNVTGKV